MPLSSTASPIPRSTSSHGYAGAASKCRWPTSEAFMTDGLMKPSGKRVGSTGKVPRPRDNNQIELCLRGKKDGGYMDEARE